MLLLRSNPLLPDNVDKREKMQNQKLQNITIGPEEVGCRVDRIVRKKCALMSLASVYKLFRTGKVRVGGKKVEQNYRFAEGDTLELHVDAAEVEAAVSEKPNDTSLVNTAFFRKNFVVIYEDSDILACNKPSGLVVHPGTGHTKHDTLIDLATAYLQHKKAIPPGDEFALVHRLDRDTSGVILIAKNKRTLRKLHEDFREHDLTKEYRAICHNRPPEFEGKISVNLSRTHERNNGMKMRVEEDGDEARSSYQIITFENNLSNVAVYLETGKTHQIRVQMTHVGAPIVGDVRYGDPQLDTPVLKGKVQRLYLHAYRLAFKHPHTRKSITIVAPVPQEFGALVR